MCQEKPITPSKERKPVKMIDYNDLWYAFDNSNWIAISGIESKAIEECLELQFLKEIKWIDSLLYLRANLKSLTTKEIFTLDNNYIVICKLKKLNLIFGKPLESNEILEYTYKLSSGGKTCYSFHIDIHSDYDYWNTSVNGEIKNIITRNGQMVEIEGELTNTEIEFIRKNDYRTWKISNLIKELLNLDINPTELKKLNNTNCKLYKIGKLEESIKYKVNLKKRVDYLEYNVDDISLDYDVNDPDELPF